VIAHFRTPRKELEELIGPALAAWQFDFADIEAFERALKDEAVPFRQADALVNLAASLPACNFESATAANILATLSANLLPGLLLMQAMGPAMTKRGFGRIVHASSIGVKFGGGNNSFVYSLSKHAQEFIPNACRQWAAQNVFVNVIRVGVTETRIHRHVPGKDLAARAALVPARRLATPTEIAESLVWFGSEANGFATGQVVAISGGE
jgi:NAD(P)-dependent dehydrogenase (short-subunit alcohol dehydrogenase family)